MSWILRDRLTSRFVSERCRRLDRHLAGRRCRALGPTGATPALFLLSNEAPELARIRGIPPGIDLRSPSRHPDILGGDDLLIKVEEMREATGYRLPVSVKLGAGRVSDDVKIAVKDGFDFIELDGMQGSTGAGSAEVIDYVGVPTLPAIIEAINALAEIGRRQDIEIVLMGGIRDGVH